MLDTLQIIIFIMSIITGTFTILMTFSKAFRGAVLGAKRKKQIKDQEDDDRRETDKCLLRDRILSFYNEHRNSGEIKQIDYENVERLYQQYKKLGGNSFVDKLWELMEEWTIIQ